jgi:hypothetical protein
MKVRGGDCSGETANGTSDYWTMNISNNAGYPALTRQSYTHTLILPAVFTAAPAGCDYCERFLPFRLYAGGWHYYCTSLMRVTTESAIPRYLVRRVQVSNIRSMAVRGQPRCRFMIRMALQSC